MVFPALKTLKTLHLTLDVEWQQGRHVLNLCNALEVMAVTGNVLNTVILVIRTGSDIKTFIQLANWKGHASCSMILDGPRWSIYISLEIMIQSLHYSAPCEEVQLLTNLSTLLLVLLSSKKFKFSPNPS